MYIPATAACSTENLPRKNSAISRQNERMNSMRVDGEFGLKPIPLFARRETLRVTSVRISPWRKQNSFFAQSPKFIYGGILTSDF